MRCAERSCERADLVVHDDRVALYLGELTHEQRREARSRHVGDRLGRLDPQL
jgi:hypothetical protein